ncbi:MAG: hypothetical protein KC777_15165 [Cyanobacteria bacterium HKST-UBA02]|nr:hypothetical protein [Cyanobacteria bacterium HKST-UBA02]
MSPFQPTSAQSILPPAPDAIGGGNPLQGLGRPDDPGPSRMDQFNPPGTIDTSREGADTASDTIINQNQNQIPGAPNLPGGAASPENQGGLPPEPDANGQLPAQIQGQIQGQSQGQLPGQPAQFQQAAPPSRPDTPLGRALTLIDRKQFSSASESLQDILKKEPDNPIAHYLMAITQVYLRNNEEARRQYQWVIENSPDEKLKELGRRGLAKLSP